MIPDHIPQISCDLFGSDEPDIDTQIRDFVAESLVPALPARAKIITFDGFDGVGKTPLARQLAKCLSLPAIDLDDYLNRHQDRFLDALKFKELSKEICKALAAHGRVIVSGCMVEAALERISLNPEFRFYVMRTSRMLSNPDIETVDEFDVLYGEQSTEQLIVEIKEMMQAWTDMPEEFGGGGDGDITNLNLELILYHREWRPHAKVDLITKIVRWY